MEELEQEESSMSKDVDLENDEGECRMCKFVLAFAFVGVFFVILFTYFFKLHTPPSIEPLPQAEVRPVSDSEWQARVLELKRTMNGNKLASSTNL